MIGMHIIFLRTDSLNKALCQSATSVFFNANLFWRFVNIYIYVQACHKGRIFLYLHITIKYLKRIKFLSCSVSEKEKWK